MIREILLPTDGSDGVIDAMNCAVGVAKAFDARLHVLHVIETPRLHDYGSFYALPDITAQLEEAGDIIIKNAKEYLRQSRFENVVGTKLDGYPADEVLDYAQEHDIDLIVIGTHGRRGLNRALLGSIAEEIVRRSEIPVMTVRMRSKT